MVYLEAKAIDDVLVLLDLLMVAELVGKAERRADKEKLRQYPKLAKASVKLAAAVELMLDTTGCGERVSLDDVWEAIDAVVSRAELRAALATVTDLVPPDADDDGSWRAELARRIVTVSGFVKILTEVIAFGSNADSAPALEAMRALPMLPNSRKKPTVADIHADVVTGPWKRLVFGSPRLANQAIHKNAYVSCVLTEFHRHLKRRDIYAEASSRWRDPRAQLLGGDAWPSAKDAVLTAIGLPEDPDDLLAAQAGSHQ